MTVSAIYEGEVRHTRLAPRPHEFRQAFYALYIDLDEVFGLFDKRWLWSASRANVAWFRRSDYLGPPDQPLQEAVLDRVEGALGRRPDGPVHLFSQLRVFGYVFNPVTFYYCFNGAGSLEAVVAEITNTPWKERHAYVLDAQAEGAKTQGANGAVRLAWSFDKDFHVSPFFDMNQVYEWAFSLPGEQLDVHMTNREAGRPVFHASFVGRRRPLTGRNLARVLWRYPLMPLRAHAAIYWHAFRLWLKRTPFFAHPDKRTPIRDANTA